jgi:hypothetical protein
MVLYVLVCFIPNCERMHVYCGDYNFQENQESGKEISSPEDGK